MKFFELEPADITSLNDGDLRDMVGRLCEAELIQQKIQPSCVLWGGAQEAPDGGLDINVKESGKLISPSFIPRQNTGFQVKKNSMSRAACTKEMQDKGCAKTVITDLASKRGAYIIVSGKDNCSDKMLSERVLGMRDAVKGIACEDDILLDFYGIDRLSTWLRQHPGVVLWVRTRLGKPLSGWMPFGRWSATPNAQNDDFLLDEHPCVIDANSHRKIPVSLSDGIQLTRDKLRGAGSTVRITGLSGVGKTRFAQALFEGGVGDKVLPRTNVIYADLGSDINPTATELIAYLIVNNSSSYVILDNCPPDIHRNMQKQVSQSNACLRLLTIEYDISDDRPEETEVIHLEPSSEDVVSKLVQKRFPKFANINADKIAEFSGGNARVALALASRVDADETLNNFSDEDLFQRLFSQRKGLNDSLLESAEILSLIYSFNVSSTECNDELSCLATISGLERRTLNRAHAELLRRQLSQQRGNWRAVLPHALSNRLARRALQNIAFHEINCELFNEKNLRLFKSCAHRLGYLHDFEPARQLAHTWVQSGAPLHDLTSCNEQLFSVLNYIAPVFPETVLRTIEIAAQDSFFTSRENKNFTVVVRLLRKIAYEDDHFEQAAAIVLKFAETEKEGENNDSIVGQLSSLFSLYLSGTQATPKRRQMFLKCLLTSNTPRHLDIAGELFRSALQTSHWSSSYDFSFGARVRDFGWEAKTNTQVNAWYSGFIELLKDCLSSNKEDLRGFCKKILAEQFRGLWSYTGCNDELEEIIRNNAQGGKWPAMWLAIKETIYYEKDNKLITRLEALEKYCEPSNIIDEVEAYAFTDTWNHAEVRRKHSGSMGIHEKIENLGKLVAHSPKYLDELAPKLWLKHVNSLWSFGKGVANGSEDQSSMFELLIKLMLAQNLKLIEPIFFGGFIQAVHESNPNLAQRLQERTLEVPCLVPHFVYLLGSNPISPWGAKKLAELARTKSIDAWRFENISYGRVHEAIDDPSLVEILSAINELDKGAISSLAILNMRFFIDKDSDYVPSDSLRALGRETICKLLTLHRDEIRKRQISGLDKVADICLITSSPKSEIDIIISKLCEGISSYRLYSFELTEITSVLIKNFTEQFLNAVFICDEVGKRLEHSLFKDGGRSRGSLMNDAPIRAILNWCDNDQGRILKIAATISSYTPADKVTPPSSEPKKVIISEHAKVLLEVSNDKLAIVEVIFSGAWPQSWSGSLASILEVRSKAFEELLEHPLPEVREASALKLELFSKSIKANREQESKDNSRHEQRFE